MIVQFKTLYVLDCLGTIVTKSNSMLPIFINICCCCVSNGAVPDLISALTTWDPLEIFVVCRWATWPWGPGLMWRTAMARKTDMDIMDFLFDGWAFPILEILKSWTYWDASRKLQRVTRARICTRQAGQHALWSRPGHLELVWGPGADKEIRNDKETVLVKLDSGIYPVAVCYSTLI